MVIASAELIPIWMDEPNSVTSSTESITFKIYNEDKSELYFEGKSIGTLSGGTYYHIINYPRICENYLGDNTIPFKEVWDTTHPSEGVYEGTYTQVDYDKSCRKFVIVILDESENETEIERYYIWDYYSRKMRVEHNNIDGQDIYTAIGMSNPIKKLWSPYLLHFTTEATIANQNTPEEAEYYDKPIVRNHATLGGNLPFGYEWASCPYYALYYVNRSGGWDDFIIEGKVVEKDKFDRNTYKKNIRRFQDDDVHGLMNNLSEHSTKEYSNNITKSFEIHTGWLTDYEASVLVEELIPSHSLYFHDYYHGRVFPGVITNTEVEYKTFKNEKTLISYQIDIDVAYEEQIR